MDRTVTVIIALGIASFFLLRYLKGLKRREELARQSTEKGRLFSEGPMGMHPRVDETYCIGCATCTTVCPEGDVLAMLGGKAVVANGSRCIGHGLCAEACPVGAITMVMGSARTAADMPFLTAEHETTVKNLFIAGELGGLALIKNAINEGRDCIDTITKRLREGNAPRPTFGVHDVLIVGAGPGGISASLRAIENKLSYITLERDEVGGTVAKFPRQKLVMTSPVQFPTYGKFKKTEISKEQLLAFWDMVLNRADFNLCTEADVQNVSKTSEGIFTVTTATNIYRARAVILALGRAGTPRKLGVRGEELGKVMYRLIEADHYTNKKILIVGGGDSAVEAAMGLASQQGNEVTLSYRQSGFHRIKDRNSKRIDEYVRQGKIRVLFKSVPAEFRPESVVVSVEGQLQEVPNDFVWVFAGGRPPTDFLRKIGVGFGMQEVNVEVDHDSHAAAVGP
jgi:thioredoxin reductase (NADPH)